MESPPAGPDSDVAAVMMRIKAQRALVIDLARAKKFDELPAAHHLLRQLEDELKQVRGAAPPAP
jgi:hypothetical protein